MASSTSTGSGAGAAAALIAVSNGKYYPNWSNNDHVCKNDGKQAKYMTNNPTLWMYDTLEPCCKARYQWNYDECMASGSTPSATPGSGTTPGLTPSTTPGSVNTSTNAKWYLKNYKVGCRQNCVGPFPCAGLKSSWEIEYPTKKMCCQQRLGWEINCPNM